MTLPGDDESSEATGSESKDVVWVVEIDLPSTEEPYCKVNFPACMLRSREILRLQGSTGPSASSCSATEHKEVSKSFANRLVKGPLILSRTCLRSLLSDTEEFLYVFG